MRGRLFAVVHEDETAIAEHRPERDDEGIDAGLPDDESVERAQKYTGQKRKRPGDRDNAVPQSREDRPCHRIEQHDGAQREGRADRQINIAVDHDDGHADGDDADGGGLLEQKQHVVEIHERLVGQRQEFARDREEDQLEDDEAPDRAVLEKSAECSCFHDDFHLTRSATRASRAWRRYRATRRE